MFSGKIDGIQVMRVIASSGIVLYHIECFFKTGLLFNFSVHLFFVISGFLAMYTTQKKKNSHYIRKRLLRILPLYYLLTVCTFAIAKVLPGIISTDGTLTELVYSLALIPYSRLGNDGSISCRPLVGPAWTLYYDLLFTIIFAGAMSLNYEKKGEITSIILLLLMLLGIVVDQEKSILHCWTRVYWLDYILGIISFNILKNIYNRMDFSKNQRRWMLLILTALAVFMISGILEKGRNVIYPFLNAAIFVMFILWIKNCRIPSWLVKIGDSSFSFYLIHYYIIFLIGIFFDFTEINCQAIIGTLVVFFVSHIVAQISYRIIEVYLSKRVMQHLGW